MKGQPVSLRIPEDIRATIKETAHRTKRDFSSVAVEMLTEAVKMRRVPGIVFADETLGRVPKVAGTGLDVFEVVQTYRDVDRDWKRLQNAFPWLSEYQLRAALAYAAAYPDEIEEHLRENERWTPEEVWSTYPSTRPPWR